MAQPSCEPLSKVNKVIDTLEADGLAPWIYTVAFSPDVAILAIGRGNDPFSGTI